MNSILFLTAAVIAFAITAILGKWMIPFLHKLKFGQTIREVGPSWHKNKQGTPTMGGLMFIIAIVAVLGPGIGNMYLAMWLVGWTSYARLVRSAVMVEKNAEYVQAARTLGYSHLRILFRHILPNVISGAIVYAVSDVLMCMLMGAGLSFLGVGVQPPTPEWGAIISGGRSFLFNAPWISIFPGIFLAVTGVGLSLLGDGLAKFFQVKGH